MLPNLKILRQERGISQQRLADAIGVSQQSINQYENHSVEPDISILSRLADHFNTSIDFIVGRTDIRRPIEHTEAFHLNRDESDVITQYRALKGSEKQCIAMMIKTLLDK
ncbi:MAG: helix-turn-helix transcriptional regulator [Bacteroidaceae bacterium]|nr:helix-turn-helix transcriptional regulator [Bacteroidaceae bacterium]